VCVCERCWVRVCVRRTLLALIALHSSSSLVTLTLTIAGVAREGNYETLSRQKWAQAVSAVMAERRDEWWKTHQAPHLVYADAFDPMGREGLSSPGHSVARMQQFCGAALSALQVMSLGQGGGTLIMRIPPVITRFDISLVYILYRHFERTSFVDAASSCGLAGDRFMVCENFLQSSRAYPPPDSSHTRI
jgi:hypothetical protein